MLNQKKQKRNERTCEHLAGKRKKEQDKAAFYRRNPHRKWNDR